MSETRIALIYRTNSPFVARDRSILERLGTVRDVWWRGKRTIPLLAWRVLRSDLAFAWFAEDHAYGACRLVELFGKRLIVVVGGGDAARRADIGYGVHLDPRRGPRSRYVLSKADRVLVVDDSLRNEIRQNTGIERKEIMTVHLGFDTTRFSPDKNARSTILTVGIVTDANLKRKGLLSFVEAARLLPEHRFILVGARDNSATTHLRSKLPQNVALLGYLTDEELLEQFRRARVYVQASMYEGLPTALGEAMACGCVPVGTRVSGIPTLIGDTGVYVRPDDPDDIARGIRDAYQLDGAPARRRIIEHFSPEKRSRLVSQIVDEVLGEATLGLSPPLPRRTPP